MTFPSCFPVLFFYIALPGKNILWNYNKTISIPFCLLNFIFKFNHKTQDSRTTVLKKRFIFSSGILFFNMHICRVQNYMDQWI